MKTTLVIPDLIFHELKRRAAEQHETMSALAAEYLRRGLRESRKPHRPFRFPTFKMGPPKVDVADRDALYEVLEGDRDARLYRRARKRA